MVISGSNTELFMFSLLCIWRHLENESVGLLKHHKVDKCCRPEPAAVTLSCGQKPVPLEKSQEKQRPGLVSCHHMQGLWLNGKVTSVRCDRTAEWKACKQWVTLRAERQRTGKGEEGRGGKQPKLVRVCVWERLESVQPQTIRPLSGSPSRHGI